MKNHLPTLALLATLVATANGPAWAQQARVPADANGLPLGDGGPASAARAAFLVTPQLPQARSISAWATVASMATARGQHAAVALNNKIYVWGGYLDNGNATPIASMEIYDAATNTWSAGASLPTATRGHAYTVGRNGMLYSFGTIPGTTSTNACYRYNPATNAWTSIASIPSYSFQAKASTGPDGRIYVIGGSLNSNDVRIYDPATDSWSVGAPLPTGRNGQAQVVDAANRIHVIGGIDDYNAGAAITAHSIYDPATNSWSSGAPLPTALQQPGAVLAPDGTIYVIGGKFQFGNNSGPFYNTVYAYNPATNAWSTAATLPVTRGETASVLVGSDVYSIGGTDGAFQNAVYRADVANAYTWTGAASTDWHTGANWSEGLVPTAVDDVTIPAGLARYPALSTATPTVRNLTVNSGGQLTIANGGTLTVTGNFVNNGAFAAAGNATVALAGSTAQSIGGSSMTQVRNLTVGAAGATLTGQVEIQRLLTLTGNLNTNGRRFLILSNHVGSALVHHNGGQVNGSTVVQRYIDPAGNASFGYRHWTPAVSGAQLSNLAVFPILPGAENPGPLQINAAYNSAANPNAVTPFPTIFDYNEGRVGPASTSLASFDQGWQSPTATSQTLVPTVGYTINQPGGSFFEVTGATLNTGNIARTGLTRGSAAEAGWHLIGNPYPSPVDWNLVGRSNVDAAAYVYRSTGRYTGGYTPYVNGVGAANVLPMGQAFFVRVSAAGASGSVSFTNSARITTYTDPTYARPTAETRPLLRLMLQRQGMSGPASEDALYVYQQAGATPAFDAAYDALKVQLNGGQQPSLYQLAGPDALSIQGLPTGSQPLSLPLGLYAPVAGTYSFVPAQLINFAATDQLLLEDRLSGTWHDLRQGAYSVALPQGGSTTRFVLHLNAARPLGTAKNTWAGEVAVYPNPTAGTPLTVDATGLRGASAQVRLISALGQTVRSVDARLSGQELHLTLPATGLAAGVYTLQVSSEAGTITRKVIFQ
ncbi:hypothetical protein GCM10027048_35620 [Hymenobacter coalescens]